MAKADALFKTAEDFVEHIKVLRRDRRQSRNNNALTRKSRSSLSSPDRKEILKKTGRRCHICGGKITVGEKWQADHVFAHAHGGASSLDNYLPAHKICNNYRWNYGAEEFQWILKLGIWFRTQIETENDQALDLVVKFMKHEARRDSRRRK